MFHSGFKVFRFTNPWFYIFYYWYKLYFTKEAFITGCIHASQFEKHPVLRKASTACMLVGNLPVCIIDKIAWSRLFCFVHSCQSNTVHVLPGDKYTMVTSSMWWWFFQPLRRRLGLVRWSFKQNFRINFFSSVTQWMGEYHCQDVGEWVLKCAHWVPWESTIVKMLGDGCWNVHIEY